MARVLVKAIVAPFTAAQYIASEPLVPASLLYVLTLAPGQHRQRLLGLLRDGIGISGGQIATIVRSLQLCLTIGLARKLNKALNRLAQNNWRLTRPGVQWDFGPGRKTELVVITGGCSGFGYEMVKGFAKVARVVVLDISPIPAELEKRESVQHCPVLSSWHNV